MALPLKQAGIVNLREYKRRLARAYGEGELTKDQFDRLCKLADKLIEDTVKLYAKTPTD